MHRPTTPRPVLEDKEEVQHNGLFQPVMEQMDLHLVLDILLVVEMVEHLAILFQTLYQLVVEEEVDVHKARTVKLEQPTLDLVVVVQEYKIIQVEVEDRVSS